MPTTLVQSGTTARDYEERLNRDGGYALAEGSRYFEGGGAVQESPRKITRTLNELDVEYAVAGGMALFLHGFRRFTEDVDILVTADGLATLHAALEDRGYRPPFAGSKNPRDTETGVRVEFLVAGQFPGDGRPKPVSFPDPSAVAIEREGVRLLNLPTLIELKLASGISSAARLKDLADVQELIKILGLPADLADALNPYVRDAYRDLWSAAASDSAEPDVLSGP
jgi:hypothetical protein